MFYKQREKFNFSLVMQHNYKTASSNDKIDINVFVLFYFFVKTFVPPFSFIAFCWSIDSEQRYKNIMAPRGTLIMG